MESNWWSKFKWIVSVYRDLKRSSSFYSTLGRRLIIGALCALPVSGLIYEFLLPEELYIEALNIDAANTSYFVYVISFATWLLGLCLIIFDIRSIASAARKVARVQISGLPGAAIDFPDYILSSAEKRCTREPIELGIHNPTKESIADHIARFNAELCVDLFSRFVVHRDCEGIYIGGLTRIPLLVAYGTFLKNISAKITYFDKFHREGKWKVLNDEDVNISFEIHENPCSPNAQGDIGIALGFSTQILKQQLPAALAENTIFLSPNTEKSRNLIMNQSNLERISESFKSIIDNLNTPDVRRVHLFLSVQSSLAIEIGRQYQEGTHRNWVIHNFDAEQGRYSWAIELSKSGIAEYKSADLKVNDTSVNTLEMACEVDMP